MKIKPINYILSCPLCGKSTIQTIRRRISEYETNCQFCRKPTVLKVIGESKDVDDTVKLVYTLKPVKVNGNWIYKSPKEIRDEKENTFLEWKEKNARWQEEEELMKELVVE